VGEEDEAWFVCTDNGWSCDAIGRLWLLKLFDRYTKVTGARRRLLLVDGHSSHVNMSFLNLADSLRIIILAPPPTLGRWIIPTITDVLFIRFE
jgi:DDE superfamily endonuclease